MDLFNDTQTYLNFKNLNTSNNNTKINPEQLKELLQSKSIIGKLTSKDTLNKIKSEEFLNMIKDPALKLNAVIQSFFDKKLLTLRNNKKEIWYNTASNKKKLMNVPYGEDPLYIISSFFQSDDGLDMYKHLKTLVKNS